MFVQNISFSGCPNIKYMLKANSTGTANSTCTANNTTPETNNKKHNSAKGFICGSALTLFVIWLIMHVKKGKSPNNIKSPNHTVTHEKITPEVPHTPVAPQEPKNMPKVTTQNGNLFDKDAIDKLFNIEITPEIKSLANEIDEKGVVPDYINDNRKFTFTRDNEKGTGGQVASAIYYDPKTNISKQVMYATREAVEYVCYPHKMGRQRTYYKPGDIIDEAYYRGNAITNPELKPFWATINGLYETEGVSSRRVMDRAPQGHRYEIPTENYN